MDNEINAKNSKTIGSQHKFQSFPFVVKYKIGINKVKIH